MTAAVNRPAGTRPPTTSPRGRDIAGRRVRDFRTPDASSGMLLVLVLLFNLLGLVMVLSASSVTGISEGANPRAYFDRQLLGLALGVVAFIITSRIHYSFWARVAQPAMFGTYAALFGVLLFGVKVDGARRWLDFGPLRFQPSELAKLTMVLFIAHLLSTREAHIGDPRRSLNAVLVFFVPLAALVFAEPDLGTTIILAAIMLSMLFVAGVPLRPLFVLGGIGVACATAAAFAQPYRVRRLIAVSDPWSDPTGAGWQTLQSLTGLANGGLNGVGLGQSRVKWGYLPNSHTDFIYAIIGEELGLLGALVVLAAVLLLGVLGYRTAMRASDLFGQLLAGGITSWFMVQAFVNIGGVVGLVPITGVTLPFVSFGASSLLVTMAAAGLLLNISRDAAAGDAARRRSSSTS